jgi:mono/diheme cytochrome c family protein
MRVRHLLVALGTALGLASCGQEAPPPVPGGSSAGPVPASSASGGDAAKGRQVYVGQCVACHNSDPAKPGPVGPAVRGASLELLAAKVVHGTYPAGYTPKQNSRVMPPRPDLAPNIPDLAAYLRQSP